jgi:tRNA-2-methylthio-N6-dimethylallyladenosine synthase
VVDRNDVNTIKSFLNLREVQLIERAELNAYDVLCNEYIVFSKSTLPGTPAAEKPELPAEVADARLQTLQALITQHQRAAQDAMVGRECHVLYEKAGRMPGQMVGKSDHLMAVHVTDATGQVGDLVRVKVIGASTNSLAAVPIA